MTPDQWTKAEHVAAFASILGILVSGFTLVVAWLAKAAANRAAGAMRAQTAAEALESCATLFRHVKWAVSSRQPEAAREAAGTAESALRQARERWRGHLWQPAVVGLVSACTSMSHARELLEMLSDRTPTDEEWGRVEGHVRRGTSGLDEAIGVAQAQRDGAVVEAR
jgi:hypothetical protein